MKRKICGLLAAVLMFSALAAIPAFAGSLEAETDGTDLELEAQGYIGITTEEEFKSVSDGKKVYLKNDITFTEGVGPRMVDVTINGKGHTVYLDGGMSLIRSGKNVTVENLNLTGDVTIGDDFFNVNDCAHYGPLSIYGFDGDVLISNVHSSVNITVTAKNITGAVGGVMGKCHADSIRWENVSYTGKMNTGTGEMTSQTAELRTVGGIAGLAGKNVQVDCVRVDATITVGNKNIGGVGGLFGTSSPESVAVLCAEFNGSLDVTGEVNENGGVGGIFGYINQSKMPTYFTGAVNNGSIKLENTSSTVPVGGLVGRVTADNTTIIFSKSANNGAISGMATAGGLVGEMSYTDKIADTSNNVQYTCVKNTGEVTAADIAGGIIGKLNSSCNNLFENCLNTARVIATAENSGVAAGIVGQPVIKDKKSTTFLNTLNVGELSGANQIPLINIENELLTYESENNLYSCEIDGDYFGEKSTREDIDMVAAKINFTEINTYFLRVAQAALKYKHKEDYTDESWQNASKAIDESISVFDNTESQEQVDAAAKKINDAVEALEYRAVDRSAVDRYIKQAESLTATDYRSDVWNVLLRAVEAGKKEFFRQSDANTAADNVKAAIAGLECKCEASMLTDLLRECNSMENKGYADKTWKAFAEALAIAENAATHKDKFNAYKLLFNAKENLIDVSKLSKLLAEIPENREDYTNNNDFWNNIGSIKQEAEKIIKGGDGDQAYVDKVTADLDKLLKKLKPKSTETTATENSIESAGKDYSEQHETDSPFASNNGGACKSTVTATAVMLSVLVALGAGVTFKKKKD